MEKSINIIAIVQARLGSIRLPGKVIKPIGNNYTIIEVLLRRLSRSKKIDKIVLATSEKPINKMLVSYIKELGFNCEMGSEDDVLDRYLKIALKYNAKNILRITGDCPLIDPILVDELIDKFESKNVDYMSNTIVPTYPDGLDMEIFTIESLIRSNIETRKIFDREHVTPYIKSSNKFKKSKFQNKEDLSTLRWTVDNHDDLQTVINIFNHFSPNIYFSWIDALNLYKTKPEIFKNIQNKRNEGAFMNKGQKLWQRAKYSIPGGNMLLSKKPEMFLPGIWPAYFSKTRGCKVWDLDNKEYIDMSMMGVGTNLLGYNNPEVDNAVTKVIQKGNMSTLNCPEEVYLAEKLIEIHPWSGGVRFARTGGEANSVAIRIARAASGKDNIAICGYHGWHDWYLSANLGDIENLDGHLLPGLKPKGVVRKLKGTTYTFKYNNIIELEKLVFEKKIGVIIMEVMRNEEPKDNFLHKVRKLANDHNIILIFDECTSGFRETLGGLHKKYDVNPDMAIFGKALGNGYAITAVIGQKDIMNFAQLSFISSTFWTERIGPSAALKTLEIMERSQSWKQVTDLGLYFKNSLRELSDKYLIEISQNGLPALNSFFFKSKNAYAYKTFITQEMLKKGYLTGTNFYACIDHSKKIIDEYFELLDPVFKTIKECENGRDILTLLEGEVCHSDFKRLN